MTIVWSLTMFETEWESWPRWPSRHSTLRAYHRDRICSEEKRSTRRVFNWYWFQTKASAASIHWTNIVNNIFTLTSNLLVSRAGAPICSICSPKKWTGKLTRSLPVGTCGTEDWGIHPIRWSQKKTAMGIEAQGQRQKGTPWMQNKA